MELEEKTANGMMSYYYLLRDTNPAGLSGAYNQKSKLTFEGRYLEGSEDIIDFWTSYLFKECKHEVNTFDCVINDKENSFLAFVTGNFQHAGKEQVLKFIQTFYARPIESSTTFYIANEIFQLNYG